MASFLHFHHFHTLLVSFFLAFNPSILGINASTVLPLTAGYYGTAFDVNVTFARDQTFLLQVDTGSADTWVLGTGWECLQESTKGTISDVSRKACLTGNSTFDYKSKNSGFTQIDEEWLGDIYGAGDAYGIVGYEDIQVGDVGIDQQQIGVVNKSLSKLDGINVGILALGYPSLSFVHSTKLTLNSTLYGKESLIEDRIKYPTFSKRLVEQGINFISLAVERTRPDEEVGFGGYMGIGTLPQVSHGSFVSTPVEVDKSIPVSFTNDTAQITEWLLTVQSVSFGSANGAKQNLSTPFQALVDSGTSNSLLPSKVASGINAAFDPPATRIADGGGAYSVDCNAKIPSFSVQIGNGVFNVDPRDMIWQSPQGRCYSNIVDSGASAVEGVSLNILGSAFMKNVVAVFDMEKDEFRFAQRHSDSPKENAGRSGKAGFLKISSFVGVACVLMILL